MKSFLLSLFGFFCVTMMSAQEISEDQFIPQLEKKQQELYTLIDQKDKIDLEIKLISKKIEKLTDEAEKKKEEEKKEKLKGESTDLKNQIVTKCADFEEYQTLLSKHQGVSEETLNKYKVRVCQLYEIEVESDDTKIAKELEKRQKALDSLEDVKDGYDDNIADLNKEIRKVKSEIEDAVANSEELEQHKKNLKEVTKKRDSILKLDYELKKQIMDSCNKFKEYKKFLKEHENVKDSILDLFKARNCRLFEEKEQHDPEKFIIIGDNEPIKASDLLSNDNTKKVLADIFSIDSKTNLGTFEIPGDKEAINFYIVKGDFIKKEDKDKLKIEELKKEELTGRLLKVKDFDKLITLKSATKQDFQYTEIPIKAFFKSIQIELLEGGIVDIRLILESTDGKTHFYFEGKDPVSLLNYSRRTPQRAAVLKFSHYVTTNGNLVYNEKALRNLRVKYTDVLDYHPNAGNNYVPDDVSYTFPSKKNEKEKTTEKRSYQVINNSHLQNVLDIRTYTDFIGLFGDEANGLFQVEGKADFFINPFNIPRSSIYYFKKVAPYVRYSRLDDGENFVEAIPNDTDPNLFDFNDDKLSILEKTNLEMGFNTNVFEFRIAKEVPFWISFYIPLSYHVTNVKLPTTVDDDFVNFKTFGVGFGTSIELKRLNNFGLNVGFEIKRYSNVGEYEKNNLIEPEKLETKAVNAEIFYYPNNNKSQSVFLRMRSIHDLSSNKEAFFQLQFGYRFTLGMGAIKAK